MLNYQRNPKDQTDCRIKTSAVCGSRHSVRKMELIVVAERSSLVFFAQPILSHFVSLTECLEQVIASVVNSANFGEGKMIVQEWVAPKRTAFVNDYLSLENLVRGHS